LGLALIVGVGIAACGTDGGSKFDDNNPTNDGGNGMGDTEGGGGPGFGGEGGVNEGGTTQTFDVSPSAQQIITVPAGTHAPTVVYTATANGNPIDAKWQVDRGDLGTITPGPVSMATFTPSGNAGGVATVTVSYGKATVKRTILVKITSQQSGATAGEASQVASTVAQLTAGGGVGGVGGEGLGASVTDPATLAALGAPTSDGSAQSLKLLYPYDATVWPRGILAPLLQWDWQMGDADAIRIDLSTTSGSFTWTGTFARPAILAMVPNGKFTRHPIPQDVWAMATASAGGADKLAMKITVAKGGVGYGPLQQSWTVATGRLSGIIYYNSYGTNLAKNYSGAVGGDKTFGGAVLSIHVGDSGPKLVAGVNALGDTNCRVCHSVAANGSRLVVQHGDNYAASSAYDLTPTSATEKTLTTNGNFAGITPDGTMMLNEVAELRSLPTDSTLLPSSGLTAITTSLGPAAFSPDGKLVAFNPMAAPTVNPTQKLGVMNFNPTTGAFTGFVTVVDDTGKPAETRPGWPAFLPDGKSLVFHHQSAQGNDGAGIPDLRTRSKAKAQIHWASSSAAGVTPLDALNGIGPGGVPYIPKLSSPSTVTCNADGVDVSTDADHGDDVNVNYEPTVSPVGAGGYAWVVFTSRRMYGSVATIPPYCSDPRGVDLITNITPKKLWVAAIDLGAAPGKDASHPAFYLPGQELLAGNARGFWVLDPCLKDGEGCDTGDECCNGYCEANGDGGALICSNTIPSCASLGDKCKVDADCCDTNASCLNGFCAQSGPVH
jgi:hypothetical protein